MALSPGATYTIVKPSFWWSRREVRNASNVLVGFSQLTGWAQMKGEGEAHGRKLLFSYSGWDNRYTRMTNASGQVLATFEPADWWGMKYKLSYNGKEYMWKLSGWGTTFTLLGGEREVLTVHPGGHFKPGTLTVHSGVEEKDAVALALFGIYEQYQINAASAAAGGGGTS